MSNPFKAFIDSWDDLESRLTTLQGAAKKDTTKLDEVLKSVRNDMGRVRLDVEGAMSRIEANVLDNQRKVQELTSKLEQNVGQHVMPLTSGMEGLKETVRNQSVAIQASQAKIQEIQAQLVKIQGAFTILTGGK